MIYTVTFNPSLDYIVTVPEFKIGHTNRSRSEEILAGGKGINVSRMLNHLGFENIALGFTAGFTGEEIKRRVEAEGGRCGFISLEQGMSRINLKMKNYEGTEINGMGPDIPPEQTSQLLEQLDELQEGDVLVLAGSIPSSMPDSIYRMIMERLSGRNILIAVDAAGNLLMNVLQYHPFLIKPNHHELGEIFGVPIAEPEEAVCFAKRLQKMGARNVLVSMAGKGAILAAEDGSGDYLPAPAGEVINAVGAGDSMVAGFLAGWLEKQDYAHAFRMGVAAGSASAFSSDFASKEEVLNIYEALKHSVR